SPRERRREAIRTTSNTHWFAMVGKTWVASLASSRAFPVPRCRGLRRGDLHKLGRGPFYRVIASAEVRAKKKKRSEAPRLIPCGPMTVGGGGAVLAMMGGSAVLPANRTVRSDSSVDGSDPRIRHIVVLMLENRSFDHMLGLLAPEVPGLRGVSLGEYGNVG